MTAEAYPLHWPEGWPKTHDHLRKRGWEFKQSNYSMNGKTLVTFDRARSKLIEELNRLRAGAIVLSTNLPLRADGQARADAALRGADPGVAVYFHLRGKPMVMACDRYDNVAANTRSLGLAIEGMRQLERHGGGQMMERAFAGFSALPPPEGSTPKRPWWEVLGYSANPEDRELLSAPEIEARYRHLAKKRHPDQGGSDTAMAELNIARDDALAELGET